MAKININKILKSNAPGKFKVVDYGSDSVRREFVALKERQDAIVKSKEVNWEKLGKLVFKK